MRLNVLIKIISAHKTNIDANTAALINLTLYTLFCKIVITINFKMYATQASFIRVDYL